MPKPTSKTLGSGSASKAGKKIETRGERINKAVSRAVRGEAARASSENRNGQRGAPRPSTSYESARASERTGQSGERAFGTPIVND